MDEKTGESQGIAALTAIYQSERSETITLLNINIALVGAELAYLAASVAFIDKLSMLPDVGTALVPAPLWLGLLYNVIIIALSGRHGAALIILEKSLHRYTGLPQKKQRLVGSLAGEYVVNPGSAGSWCYRPALYIVYAIPPVLIGLYTWYILDAYTKSFPVFVIGLAAYGVALAAFVAAFAKAALSTPEVS